MLNRGSPASYATRYAAGFEGIDMVLSGMSNYEQMIDNISDMKDLHGNVRPELLHNLESIDKYDEIYIGFPNYWGTMPMAMFTFLEQFDWAGKSDKLGEMRLQIACHIVIS